MASIKACQHICTRFLHIFTQSSRNALLLVSIAHPSDSCKIDNKDEGEIQHAHCSARLHGKIPYIMHGGLLPAPRSKHLVAASLSTSRAGAARHFIRRTLRSAADSASLWESMDAPMFASRGPTFCLRLASQPTAAGTGWVSRLHPVD